MIRQNQIENISEYSILSLKTKIQHFLVYFLHYLNQNKFVKFSYDCRTQILNIQGNIDHISQCRFILIQLLQQYDVGSFSIGFSAAKFMNFIVGSIADRPKIKYFDQQKIKQIFSPYPNIHIQIEKNKTYMVGPIQQVKKLTQDVAKFVVKGAIAVGTGYCQMKKQNDLKKKIGQQVVNLKPIQKIQKFKKVQNIYAKQEPIKNMQQNKKKQYEPNKIQKVHKKIVQHTEDYFDFVQQIQQQKKTQIKLFMNLGSFIVLSTACCQYLTTRCLQLIKFKIPPFKYLKSEKKSKGILIQIQLLKINQKYEQVAQNIINQQIQNLDFQAIKIDPQDNLLIQKIKVIKQYILFLADDNSIIIHVAKKALLRQKKDYFHKFMVQLLKQHNVQKNKMKQEKQLQQKQNKLLLQQKQQQKLLQLGKKQDKPKKSIPEQKIIPFSVDLPSQLNSSHTKIQTQNKNSNSNNVDLQQQNTKPIKGSIPAVSFIQPPAISIIAGIPVIQQKIIKIKKLFKFLNMIGQQMWKYVQQMSENFMDINVNFNAQSKFLGKISYTRIYEDSSFYAKGPQDIMKKFGQKIQQKIQTLKKQFFVLSFQVTNQTHKNIWQQLPQLQILQQKYRIKIIINPEIGVSFKLKQLKNTTNQKHQIIGIKGSQCDLLIDKYESILVFDRFKDYEKFKEDFVPLRNIVDGQFYTFLAIRQRNLKKRLIQCISDQINNFINNTKKPQRVKIFAFAQSQALQQLIWGFLQISANIQIPQIKFYLVCNQKSNSQFSNKNIPDRYRRWYVELAKKTYYSQHCNLIINKAIQNGDKQVFISSDDIQVYQNQFTIDIKNKTMKNNKYPNIQITYKDYKNWIQFDYQGHTHKLNQSNYQQLRKSQITNQNIISLNICIFLIKLDTQQQINIWNSYSRKIKHQQQTLQHKNFILTTQSSIHPIQIIGQTNQQIYCTKQQLFKQFYYTNIKQQTLKLKSLQNYKDNIKIQQLYKLCSINNIIIKKINQKQIIINYQYGNNGIQIIRKYVQMMLNVIYAIQYPQNWLNNNKQYSQIQIQINDKNNQYINIKKLFPYKYKILKIKRIQNCNAYTRYFNQNKFLQKLNNGKKIQQKYLFHGTRTIDPLQITSDKQITFNINYSADNNYMGRATYFAEKAQYSHQYRYKINKNIGVMLLCLVLIGDSQKCPKLHVNYRDTDFKNKQKTIRYQSMTQFYDGSQIYTVYKNNRAYPMYRIEYSF